jgi:hypothetical protein
MCAHNLRAHFANVNLRAQDASTARRCNCTSDHMTETRKTCPTPETTPAPPMFASPRAPQTYARGPLGRFISSVAMRSPVAP